MLTGITEPIEFTFLFISPLLYYGIHVPLCAFSGLFSNLTSLKFYVSIPSNFGGIIELFVFGILP
jgi:PTS system glucose-specific IIC component